MNRAVATCWMFILLSAFFCETVMSKGGRGGARGAARGSARASRTRFKAPRRYSSSPARVAGAAAAGAAVGMAAGGWYASSRYRSDDSSERFISDSQGGNRTDGDFYSARTSASAKHDASLIPVLSVLCSISLLKYISL
ncbi:shadow of prion protein [Megalops cyprinoides]|uniref:shadow of prion protein n=1 Tax=Megalops cyprinoides TaxID=118141 RepID=UPI0018653BFF|nr:shadow of prion protein [Megalops cyprinoides]